MAKTNDLVVMGGDDCSADCPQDDCTSTPPPANCADLLACVANAVHVVVATPNYVDGSSGSSASCPELSLQTCRYSGFNQDWVLRRGIDGGYLCGAHSMWATKPLLMGHDFDLYYAVVNLTGSSAGFMPCWEGCFSEPVNPEAITAGMICYEGEDEQTYIVFTMYVCLIDNEEVIHDGLQLVSDPILLSDFWDEFILSPIYEVDLHSAGSGFNIAPEGSTGHLTLIGGIGCDPCALNPPEAHVAVEHEYAELDVLTPCDDLTEQEFFANSCRFRITDESVAGECPLVKGILITSAGTISVLPGGTAAGTIWSLCGAFSDDGAEYFIYDECGCYDFIDVADISCCGCCTPTGELTINSDDNVDGIDASNCDQPTDLAPDPCCSWGHQWCYYSVHFDPVDVGECSAGGGYLVDWGCIQARDGGSPPLCVFPGETGVDVRVRVDAGCYGQCCCLGVTVFNYEGCAAETTYSSALIGNAFCMAREDYDLIDPEVFGDCYPLLIPYDCPPV